jgi:flagellar biosynthesis regulator FlbT
MAMDQTQNPWRRIASTKALNEMRIAAAEAGQAALATELNTMITTIKEKETMEDLIRIYQQFGSEE